MKTLTKGDRVKKEKKKFKIYKGAIAFTFLIFAMISIGIILIQKFVECDFDKKIVISNEIQIIIALIVMIAGFIGLPLISHWYCKKS